MNEKIVEFDKWCPLCKHFSESAVDDPCNECLNNPANEDSTKPVMWEKK